MNLEVKTTDHTIVVPVYILPGAKPPCLLGLSAARELDLESFAPDVLLKDENVTKNHIEQGGPTARVRLTSAQCIPWQRGAGLKV